MARLDRDRCPTPLKDRFDTPADARAALKAHTARLQGFTGSVPIRAYRCTCGRWHVTGDSPGSVPRRRHADRNHRNKKASHRRKWSRACARRA